jgi:hypothetical protein
MGCYLPLSLGGNNDVIHKLFPPRENLVSDIPAEDGNIEKLFYSAYSYSHSACRSQFACLFFILPPVILQLLSLSAKPLCCLLVIFTAIRFVFISAKFGFGTVAGPNGHLLQLKREH